MISEGSPDNILITNENICKISDFSLSKMVKQNEAMKMTKQIGTPQYMSPEVTTGQPYGKQCDSFSFGIIMFELIHWTVYPYSKDHSFGIEFKVAQDENCRPTIDTTLIEKIKMEDKQVDEIIDLMKRCWRHDPNERPFFTEITQIIEISYDQLSQLLQRPQ